MKQLIIHISLVLLVFNLSAQSLLPSIGLFSEPSDSDAIAPIPFALDDPGHENTGPPEGSPFSDFTLYDLLGNEVSLADELEEGLPILLISGSYTCPRFRNNMPAVNEWKQAYENQIKIFVIYCVEAHPIVDPSPYFGFVNTGQNNIDLGITYEQPDTYGERKIIVNDMLSGSVVDIDVPVLIDGPGNEWWSVFGPAENNAYLLTSDGIIFKKHGWLNLLEDMEDSILEILDIENDINVNGLFESVLLEDTVQYGESPIEVIFNFELTNMSESSYFARTTKYDENIPNDWFISLCADACLPPEIPTTLSHLEEFEIDQVSVYFFNESPGIGDCKIDIVNEEDSTNAFSYHLFAEVGTTGLNDAINQIVSIGPNPAEDFLYVKLKGFEFSNLHLYDLTGRLVYSNPLSRSQMISVIGLSPGLYIYKMISQNRMIGSGNLMIR